MAMHQHSVSPAQGRFPYAAAFKEPVIDIEAIRRTEVSRDPYTHMLVDNVLNADVVPALRAGFPNITKPGFLTVDEVQMQGKFKQLIDELESPELSEVMSERMGIDTIRKISQAKDGRSHTDGTAKVMTLLVYMNDAWNDDGAGRLRVLYGPDGFEPYKLEVPPTMGTMFAFLRADNSWHGHPPFAGERRVVQVAWVKDENELARKKKRNSMAQFFKGIFGR